MDAHNRIVAVLAGSVLLLPAAGALAQFDFDAAVNYPVTGARPDGVAALDYDRDGDLDVAVVTDVQNVNRERIEIFRNNGSGVLTSAFEIVLPNSSSPGDLEAADFDGDGDADLAVVLKDFNVVQMVINTGGSFSLGSTASIGSEGRGMSQGDIDNDGDADLIVANRDSNTATVLRNAGNAAFASITLAAQLEPRAGTFFDLDQDGDLDAAVTNHDSRSISLFRNNGATFASAGTLSVGSSVRPEGVTAGDFNGDGRDDLAANIGDNGIEWVITFLNQGGAFGASTRWVTNGLDGSEVLAGDFDNDGDADLASLNASSNNVSLLANSGTGAFAAPQLVAVGTEPDKIAAADLDNDGDSDLVVSNKLSNTISVLMNQASVAAPVEAPLSRLMIQIGQRLSGNLNSLRDLDTNRLRVRSVQTSTGTNPRVAQIVVTAVSPETDITRLDLTTVMRVNMPGCAARIWLRNWNTNRWVLIDNFSQPTTEDTRVYADIADPDAYVNDADGRIQIRIRLQNQLDQFDAFYNLIQFDVTP